MQAQSCSYTQKLLSRDLSSLDKPVAAVLCVLPKGTKSAVTLSSADKSMLEYFLKHCLRGEGQLEKLLCFPEACFTAVFISQVRAARK